MTSLDTLIAAAVERRDAEIAAAEAADQERRDQAIAALQTRIDRELTTDLQHALNLVVSMGADDQSAIATCEVDTVLWRIAYTTKPYVHHWCIYNPADWLTTARDGELSETLLLAIHDWRKMGAEA